MFFSWKFFILKKKFGFFWEIWCFCVGPVGSGNQRKSSERNEKVRVLWAPTELGAHILGFWCTIGTYLRAKYEGQTPTELGERARSIFGRICSHFPLSAASVMISSSRKPQTEENERKSDRKCIVLVLRAQLEFALHIWPASRYQ